MADFTLLTYDQVDERAKANLLLGNGFSQGLHAGFQYGSLKQKAEDAGLIGSELRGLFERLGTVDFEQVLSRLVEAQLINAAFGLSNESLERGYLATRGALIEVVSRTHPRRQELDDLRLLHYRGELRRFHRIFTTNYDLLLYWIAAHPDAAGEGLKGFRDFFWSEGNSFDLAKVARKKEAAETASADDRAPEREPTFVYYLHGALFLSRKDGKVRKVRRQGKNDLLTTLHSTLADAAPVFVSEGDASAKRRSIAQHDYLEWTLGELEKLSEGITVFGHSLSKADDHILAALCRNLRGPLAVAIYASTAKDQRRQAAALRERFAAYDKEDGLEFFDARTFPLIQAEVKK